MCRTGTVCLNISNPVYLRRRTVRQTLLSIADTVRGKHCVYTHTPVVAVTVDAVARVEVEVVVTHYSECDGCVCGAAIMLMLLRDSQMIGFALFLAVLHHPAATTCTQVVGRDEHVMHSLNHYTKIRIVSKSILFLNKQIHAMTL